MKLLQDSSSLFSYHQTAKTIPTITQKTNIKRIRNLFNYLEKLPKIILDKEEEEKDDGSEIR